ncbi:class I SAM-dependent methyltransferase [Acuticoccus sp. MNP-M23]|uniref:class I SAM-dependent methyltransferase n=1 Tax=Acuticoccus sp. MNP-M23 TaxID=3072793 RepID=UPI002815EF27|nr:class I SAM-dependent methyltransferase [Acuticoccus sp. MNP-M23]WMS41572.1 class I SAM-dependent methyltransferase [Acuticoccus sp. MNP-M23]
MMKDTGLKQFARVGMWPGGGEETVSGAGSTVKYTDALRPKLEAIVRDLGVRRVLDAPCGDFNWMRHVDLGGASYVGLDIVDEVIARNIERHAAPGCSFVIADVTVDPLPPSDLLVCRDLLLHLPFENILDLFKNVADAELKWVLISSYVNPANRDLGTPGEGRLVNLTLPPFNFPAPDEDRRIVDWVKGYPERYLYLYDHEIFRSHAYAAIEKAANA